METILYLMLIPISIGGIFGIITFIAFIYKKIRNIETYKEFEYLNRDISTDMTPSTVSYLLNQKVGYKDLIADIMDLYAMKVINIEKQEDYTFRIQENVNGNVERVKSESQKYILNTLLDKNDDKVFNFTKWKTLVIEEYKSNSWTKNAKSEKTIETIAIAIILASSIIGGIVGWNMEKSKGNACVGVMIGFIISLFIMCFYIAFMEIQKENGIFLNKQGKKELKKWIELKKFMKDYTLLKDRNIEEIILYEKYIPYSIALGVNVTYRDTIFDIFDEEEFKSIIEDKSLEKYLDRYGI